MNSSANTPPLMPWPRYQHVIFDCDSTLSRIEGIDELASHPGTKKQVADLTNAAMDGGVSLREVYGERLNILNPTRGAVRALKSAYQQHIVEDAAALVRALHTLGHEVYIVSGGLLDPVREFGMSIGVKPEHIRAVEVEFDRLSGSWWDSANSHWQERYLTYQQTELAESDGKAKIIRELLSGKTGRSLLIGDGVSDLLAAATVDLFVGFCGVIKRERVAAEAPVYIDSASLAPLLCLAADRIAIAKAEEDIHNLASKARNLIENKALHFNNTKLAEKFTANLAAESAKHDSLFNTG